MKFLTSKAGIFFTQLRQAFIKSSILQYFDPKCPIQIKSDISNYIINEVLIQLTFDQINFNQVTLEPKWYLVTYFSRKMIFAKTRYRTHDDELLTIVEAFKTWRHYLEGCRYEVLVLSNHNNLYRFMDIKSSSSYQVRCV